jgi:hypothetical protein
MCIFKPSWKILNSSLPSDTQICVLRLALQAESQDVKASLMSDAAAKPSQCRARPLGDLMKTKSAFIIVLLISFMSMPSFGQLTAEYWMNYSTSLASQGRYADAVLGFDSAIKMDPKNMDFQALERCSPLLPGKIR